MSENSTPFYEISDATLQDATDILEIYEHHVITGTGTFEETPPDQDMMRKRIEQTQSKGYPYLVARHNQTGKVIGYAYTGPFRDRSAYKYTVEDSIYVHPDFQRKGIATHLLKAAIEECTQAGFRQMFALIGGAQNRGSIGLHRKAGFLDAGRMANAGYKAGRWLDVIIMQLPLGEGCRTPPEPK